MCLAKPEILNVGHTLLSHGQFLKHAATWSHLQIPMFNGQACSLGVSEWGSQAENPQARQRCSSWANWDAGEGGSMNVVFLYQGSKRTTEEKIAKALDTSPGRS